MPFTEQQRREQMLDGELAKKGDVQPGDRCFEKYQQMMDAFEATPRWRTIDKIAESIIPGPDSRATFLAFLVFMHFHGFPYEEIMREKNGDIRGRGEIVGLPKTTKPAKRALWRRLKDAFFNE